MQTHSKASCWACAQSAHGALLFDTTMSKNKVRMQEEAEKKKKTWYTWLLSTFTLTDRGIWEIHILICKNESFSNRLRLVRSFLDGYASSKSPFFTSEMFGNDCLQRKPSGKSVFKLGSLALHLDVHICMWVYQELWKASMGRLFSWLIHGKFNTFTDSFAYWKGLEVAMALSQSELLSVFPGGPGF